MPKFKCQNEKCSNFDKEEYYPKVRYKFNEQTERLECDESFCGSCGDYRETIKDYEGPSNIWFKGEKDRNYNNKSVKKYDYDEKAFNNQTATISKKGS